MTVFVSPARQGAAAGAPGAVAGDPVKVPAIDGRSVTAYANAVAATGLVPRVIRTVSREPVGALVDVRPAPGRPLATGDRVRLLVSAGSPQLAYDTGEVVRLFDPRLGRTVREASPPAGLAVEPSWSPDGRRLIYRVGRRLMLVSARLGDRGRVVYEGATKYAAATFAPAPADGVLALVRRTSGDGDLCFARVGSGMLRPRCSADRRWDLGRQISWRAAAASCSCSAYGAVSLSSSASFGIAAHAPTPPIPPIGAGRSPPTSRPDAARSRPRTRPTEHRSR